MSAGSEKTAKAKASGSKTKPSTTPVAPPSKRAKPNSKAKAKAKEDTDDDDEEKAPTKKSQKKAPVAFPVFDIPPHIERHKTQDMAKDMMVGHAMRTAAHAEIQGVTFIECTPKAKRYLSKCLSTIEHPCAGLMRKMYGIAAPRKKKQAEINEND